jgi:predicted dienelactone hydrolase
LLLTGGRDQQLPPATHVAPMRHLLPKHSRHLDIRDAHHFSFLPLCGDNAVELLAESAEEFVCQEFGNETREQIHAEALGAIIDFLAEQHVLEPLATLAP